MKQLKINIPDSKYPFFLELLNSFDYVEIEEAGYVIPQKHMDIVRDRDQKSEKDPSRRKRWDDVKGNLKY